MNENQCDLCELLPKLDPIFETDNWKAILNQDQGYLGRCFVTLKVHKGSLSEISDDEWLDFGAAVKKLEKALKQAFGADNFNWTCLTNNAYQEESPTPHVHWHVRPRYSKSVTFAGLEFNDPEFGYHYNREQRCQVEEDVLSAIKKEIQTKLD